MVLLYCDRCGKRIPDGEQPGRMQTNSDGGTVCICVRCSGAVAPEPVAVDRPSRRTTRATGVVPLGREPSAVPRQSASQSAERGARATGRAARNANAAPSAKLVLIALAVVVGLAIAITIVLLTSKKDESRAETAPQNADASASRVAAAPVAAKELAAYPLPQGSRKVSQDPAPVLSPASAAPPGASPVLAPASKKEDDYDPRSEVAASLLAQAQAFNKANPGDVWAYKDKLEQLKERYGSTQSGKEAARLLSEIKLPEVDPATNPAPPADSAWANAVQVLPLVDPNRGRQQGNWGMAGGALRSDKSMWARFALPYILPEEYDVRVTFTRVDNTDCLLVVLARRGRPFIFSIGGAGNNGCSFETIRESRRDSMPTKISRSGVLANNQRYQLVIQVRSKCLRAHLNGKPMVGCQVDDDGLSLAPEMRTPQPNQLGLAAWDSVYEFHAIEVLPLTGEGQVLK